MWTATYALISSRNSLAFSEKTQNVSRIIATAIMEVFVALVSSFHSLIYFTKNNNIGAMRVLIAPLEYYNAFWNLCRWSIKYCRTVASNFSKDISQANKLLKLFKWLRLCLIPYKLKYSTASNLNSSCVLRISRYLAKHTFYI